MKAPAAFDINLLGIKSLGFSPPSPPFTNINLHNTEHRPNSVYFLFFFSFRHIFSNISLDLVYPTEVTSQNFPISINPISVITYAICPHAVNHNVELYYLLFFSSSFSFFFFFISFLDSSPSFFPPHPPFFLLSFILELRILHDY